MFREGLIWKTFIPMCLVSRWAKGRRTLRGSVFTGALGFEMVSAHDRNAACGVSPHWLRKRVKLLDSLAQDRTRQTKPQALMSIQTLYGLCQKSTYRKK